MSRYPQYVILTGKGVLGQEPERDCKSSDRGARRLKTFVLVPFGDPEARGAPADGLGDFQTRAPGDLPGSPLGGTGEGKGLKGCPDGVRGVTKPLRCMG